MQYELEPVRERRRVHVLRDKGWAFHVPAGADTTAVFAGCCRAVRETLIGELEHEHRVELNARALGHPPDFFEQVRRPFLNGGNEVRPANEPSNEGVGVDVEGLGEVFLPEADDLLDLGPHDAAMSQTALARGAVENEDAHFRRDRLRGFVGRIRALTGQGAEDKAPGCKQGDSPAETVHRFLRRNAAAGAALTDRTTGLYWSSTPSPICGMPARWPAQAARSAMASSRSRHGRRSRSRSAACRQAARRSFTALSRFCQYLRADLDPLGVASEQVPPRSPRGTIDVRHI